MGWSNSIIASRGTSENSQQAGKGAERAGWSRQVARPREIRLEPDGVHPRTCRSADVVHRIVADVEAALRRNAESLRGAMKQLGGRLVHAFFAGHEHDVDLGLEIETSQLRPLKF